MTRERIVQVLGIDPPTAKVREVLTGLGFSARWVPPDRYVVRVPYWRPDVRIDDDVAEEVARVIGYDQIPALPLAGAIPPPIVQPLRELRERTRDLLAAAGMREVISYSMTTMEALSRVMPKEDARDLPAVSRREPDQRRPRVPAPDAAREPAEDAGVEPALPEGRGRDLRDGAHVRAPGRAAAAVRTRPSARRRCRTSASVVVRRRQRAPRSTAGAGPATSRVDFFDAKAYVEDLLRGLGRRRPSTSPATSSRLAPGRTAEIRVGGAARRRRRAGASGRRRRRSRSSRTRICSRSCSMTCCRIVGGAAQGRERLALPGGRAGPRAHRRRRHAGRRAAARDRGGAARARGARVRRLHRRPGARRARSRSRSPCSTSRTTTPSPTTTSRAPAQDPRAPAPRVRRRTPRVVTERTTDAQPSEPRWTTGARRSAPEVREFPPPGATARLPDRFGRWTQTSR